MHTRYLRRQIRALWHALLVERALRSTVFEQAVRRLRVLMPGQKSPLATLDTPEIYAVVRAVERVYRHTPLLPDTCLRRALTVGTMLRHFTPALRLGVKKSPSALDAHAWLEFGELVVEVNQISSRGYVTLKKS